MKSRPILFSGPMVRALLAGTKTQTRRVVKPQPTETDWACCGAALGGDMSKAFPNVRSLGGLGLQRAPDDESRAMGFPDPNIHCPYGYPGDQLWVRETHALVPPTAYAQSEGVQQTINPDDRWQAAIYAAGWDRSGPGRWRPSIHMPRWASRITLEITDVRVQRLQEISEEDAQAEGAAFTCPKCGWDLDAEEAQEIHFGCDEDSSENGSGHREGYRRLWDSINGPGSWDLNPWVWALTFKRTA